VTAHSGRQDVPAQAPLSGSWRPEHEPTRARGGVRAAAGRVILLGWSAALPPAGRLPGSGIARPRGLGAPDLRLTVRAAEVQP
jgi:hypothetical protein